MSIHSHTYLGSREKGFTLLELLASIALMGLVMALATFSLSQFGQYSDRSGLVFESRINRYLSLGRLGDLLQSTLDYYVVDNLDHTQLFFRGGLEKVEFVSQTSWQVDNQASINILAVEESVTDPNLFSLVLYHRPLVGKVFFALSELPEKESLPSNLILDGAERITFEYLGIEDIRDIYPNGISENFLQELDWRNRYNSLNTGYIPIKFRMNVEWPDGSSWPCIISIKAQNYAKRGFMLDGTR